MTLRKRKKNYKKKNISQCNNENELRSHDVNANQVNEASYINFIKNY